MKFVVEMLRFYPEIEGKQTFQNNIVLQTLNSKRLLIDHVEILEECLATIEPSRTHTFTAPKFLALTSVGVICTRLLLRHPSSRWTLPALAFTSATYATCYGVKLTNRFHFRRQEESLARLIKSLDRFEAAIRRNLLFLNDAQHAAKAMTTTKLSQQDCFTGNCVRVCMDVVRKIHGAVTRLERGHELDERWREVYVPMEDLEDCVLFGEEVPDVKGAAGVRIIKDLYNIYAYVQSQFLTRLALTVACGMTDFTSCRLTELSMEIDALKEDCMKYLDRITDSKKEVIPRPVAKSLPAEVANLRSHSTALSMKMLKTAHRYNQLEDLLQESTEQYQESNFVKQLSFMETSLEEISSELVASDEECQRLLILVKKLSNKEDPLPQLPEPPEPQPEPAQNQPIYSEQYNPPQKDEFFAVDGNDPQESDEDHPPLNDLEAIDSKIVKRHFRPVLQQLRERIEPIGVEFREREKRALQHKGILLEEEQESVPKKANLYGSSDEEDEEEEGRVGRKEKRFQRSVERYDEVRGFLAAKEQMNIFAVRPPPLVMMGNGMEEEVLE